MLKIVATAALICVLSAPAQSWYAPVVVPPPPPPPLPASAFPQSHNAAGGLAWGAGSIIGIAAFLSGYDIARRWFCIGDPLRLGGPGFSEPMPKYGNVKPPPACGRPVLRVRG